MNLGTTMMVFIVCSAVLLTLFCLLLKYFHYRQHRNQKEAMLQYSPERDISLPSMHQCQGQYDEFCKKRESTNKSLREELLGEDVLIEMNQLRKIFDVSNNIYSGHHCLRDKLVAGTPPKSDQERRQTCRLEFKLSKLSTYQQEHPRASKQNPNTSYKFVKKITKYDRTGLIVLQKNPVSLSKEGEKITLKKKLENTTIDNDTSNFDDILDTYGCQMYNYGCWKIECQVDISQLKEKCTYPFSILHLKEQRQEISLQEFREYARYVWELQQSI